MVKKLLLNLPADKCQKVVPDNRVKKSKGSKIKFIMTAAVYEVDGQQILKATMFDINSHEALYLIFCDQESKEFISYRVPESKWSDACIINLTSYWNFGAECVTYADNDSLTAGARYFGHSGRTTVNEIQDFQMSIRDFQLRRRYENGRRFIDNIMNKAEELPTDINQFIDNHVLKKSRYMYYHREGKVIHGYCTHCHQNVTMPAVKGTLYNEEGTCPHCHSKVCFKPKGRATNIDDTANFLYIQRLEDGLLLRDFEVTRIHGTEYQKPFRQSLFEHARYYISFNGRSYSFEYKNTYFRLEGCVTGWHKLKYGDSFPDGNLYTGNLNRAFKGTPYQYCQLSAYAKHKGIVDAATYLTTYQRSPAIEYFVKLKMYNLLGDILNDAYHNCTGPLSNPCGKNPVEVLGVSKSDMRQIISLNISGKELEFWRWCRIYEKPVTEELIGYIRKIVQEQNKNNGYNHFSDRTMEYCKEIYRFIPLQKGLNYMLKQKETFCKEYGYLDNVIRDWTDYIKNCEKMQYNMADDSILLPRDLKKAHDRAYKLVQTVGKKIADKRIRAMYLQKLKRYGYREKEFFITVASSASDLIDEGQKMHHCVGTYIDRVADDECTILFIRRTAEPDKPLATCEVRGNESIQIRAHNDAVPNKDVMAFWERFKEKKLKKQPKKEKTEDRKAG
jgi:hypothetical protein